MYHQARLLGEPRLLPLEEIDRVATKLDSYGQAVPPVPSGTAR
jgi:L-fuculose-phosphate aldolase